MNTFVVFAGLLALAAGVPVPEEVAVEAVPAAVPAAVPTFNAAPILIRAPAHDSASIESHRLGGNFAYAVAEAHAYAQVTPQLSTITHPVAETTVVHEPAPIAHVTPGKVITTKPCTRPGLSPNMLPNPLPTMLCPHPLLPSRPPPLRLLLPPSLFLTIWVIMDMLIPDMDMDLMLMATPGPPLPSPPRLSPLLRPKRQKGLRTSNVTCSSSSSILHLQKNLL